MASRLIVLVIVGISSILISFGTYSEKLPYDREPIHITKNFQHIENVDTAAVFSMTGIFKIVAVYKYDSTFSDSSEFVRIWFRNDSTPMFITGSFYHCFPFQSGIEEIVTEAKGKKKYETFNPDACEAGGTSAWNRYLISYNKYGLPDSIRHYKAFRGNESGEEPMKYPTYKEPSVYVYTWSKYEDTQKVYGQWDGVRHLSETFIRRFDNKGRLIFNEWTWSRFYFYRAYVTYN